MLQYIIPVASIFISFLLGCWTKSINMKQEALKLRYEQFYAPYLQLLTKAIPFRYKIEELSFETQSRFCDLILNNCHLLGPNSAESISEYYYAFIKWIPFDDKENPLSTNEDYSRCFHTINKSILRESSKLSKKLKLPDLGQELYAIFYSQQKRT